MKTSIEHVSLFISRRGLLAVLVAIGISSALSAQWQQAKLGASDGASSDLFGASVSMSGDTALAGALGDDNRRGSVYVFVRDVNGNWTQQAKLTAADAATGDRFGSAVSLSGDTALIGADGDGDAGLFTGSAYVFVRDVLGRWTQQGKLTASDASAGNLFGGRVSLDGDTALVGANGERNSSNGSAYVFVRDASGHWSDQVKLTADDGATGDRFGYAVSLDGDTALIGADKEADAGNLSGSAYVYVRDGGGNWTQQAKLTATDAATGDFFGASVSLCGNVALVGANGDNDAGENSGSVYEFARDGMGTWTEQGKLTAADADVGDQFGVSVFLSGDAALVGAYGDDAAGPFSGSAYVMVRDGMGGWMQLTKLADVDGQGSDFFGVSVSMDRDTVMVGAFGDNDRGFDSGSAFCFCLGKLTAEDATLGDNYGQSVALRGDTALVGATGGANGQSFVPGSAYVHTRGEGGVWAQQGKLTADDGIDGNQFGYSVALSVDTALVGAMRDGTPSQRDSGSAYVFVRDGGGTWSQQAKLNADDSAFNDFFGVSVSLSGDTALVGALFDKQAGVMGSAGAGYVFVRDGVGNWTQQAKLASVVGTNNQQLGISVSLDGDTALLGGNGADGSKGAAYVFVRDGGGNWTQQARLTADDGSGGDEFGYSVTLSGDTALIGTRISAGLGAAYVFVRDELGTWTQQAKLVAPGIPSAQFGISVSLDGDEALIGAYLDAGIGSAHKYARDASGVWTRVDRIFGLEVLGDGIPGDRFGIAVALSGNTMMVGDSTGSAPGVSDSGAAYVFCVSPGSFVTLGTGCAGSAGVPRLRAVPGENPSLGDRFGLEISGLPGSFANTPIGILGFSKTDWSGFPLPLDASLAGLTGCTLYVSMHKTFPLYNLGGRALWRIDIPLLPNLIGTRLYMQAIVIDFGANAASMVLSNAGETVIVGR